MQFEQNALALARIDLVIANRVLARCGAVDAYGHVSIRHPSDPGRLLIARSLSPEFVEEGDILELTLDAAPAGADRRGTYREKFIHTEIYRARPDVHAVVHGHPIQVLPFSVSQVPLRPVYFGANECGADIPVWDIRDEFGDTNLLISDRDRGAAAARALGVGRVVLLRGHGMIGVGRSAMHLVRVAKSLLVNAQMYSEALRLGPVVEMSPGELASRDQTVGVDETALATIRGWEYEARMAGCADLLEKRRALTE